MQRFLVDIKPEDLTEISRLSGLFFTPAEIARMLELNAAEFLAACEDVNSPVYESFYSGRLQGEVDLRTGIMKMAKAGSSPAQTMAMDLLKQSKVKMLDAR